MSRALGHSIALILFSSEHCSVSSVSSIDANLEMEKTACRQEFWDR